MTKSVASSQRTVVLVHGFKDDARKMRRIALRLRALNWNVLSPTLKPSWGQAGIDVLAEQLADYLREKLPEDASFNLVGFSMGGLVCRYYLQRLGGVDRVERFVGISVPHHGTLLARFWPGAGSCQMRIGSDFLSDLNADSDELTRIRCTTIWTPLDLIILPPSSSRAPFGRDERMWVLAHPLMVWQSKCVNRIAALLTE